MQTAAPSAIQGKKSDWRWTQVPLVSDPVLITPDGEKIVLWAGLKASEAAKLLGCHIRTVQAMCDEGRLEENKEWRRIPSRGMIGRYRIRREAIDRLLADPNWRPRGSRPPKRQRPTNRRQNQRGRAPG
jgi:excisionase family DNA binding protein